ncbi:pancortin-3 [Shewanella baltica]|uniref:Cap15 family cyclic dinucleotide receptor domain-containing protein n=1 Tax=Shewanella TaxID=22 RepID=UPI00217E559B|nr:hypothetical protein [Shewanella baltica]MCS6125001.1 pancortin-3 [Shewanella baltica]MCS6137030.1 pancortin-3 [Shewanella baltica]
MHDYAVFGHDRSSIGRWLGLGAIVISGGIAQLLAMANDLTGLDAFTKVTITTGLVYFALHWLFNKWIWKVPFFEVPDLNGRWEVKSQTLNEDGSTRYYWEAEIGVEQDWKKILLHLKTEKSQSNSYTATLSKRYGPTGGWRLSYSYRNEPELEQSHELSSHKGYCEIEFDKDLKKGRASYFNSAGRRTFGVMDLIRKSK